MAPTALFAKFPQAERADQQSKQGDDQQFQFIFTIMVSYEDIGQYTFQLPVSLADEGARHPRQFSEAFTQRLFVHLL
jgi:hypothetical protein